MSVAFRRESDEEHKEPRFELPIPPGPNFVTARGMAQIEARIGELEAGIASAGSPEEAEPLKRELRYWNTRSTTARPAPVPTAGEAGIGSRVRIRLNGAERTIEIVGHDEADPASGKVAFSAPLARAIMGRSKGEFGDFGDVEDAVAILEVIDPQDVGG